MKNILLFLYLLSQTGVAASFTGREYNTWYNKDGVRYDMTQTADSRPVLISISQPGTPHANMVISWAVAGQCPHAQPLVVDEHILNVAWECSNIGEDKYEHFMIDDARQVNAIVERLQAQFTVIIQGDIKVWASNYNLPEYGSGPRLF